MNRMLAALVATVEEKFPDVCYKAGGSRAKAAAEFVELKAVVYAGDINGVDYWTMGGYTTSIKGGGCTCLDEGAPNHSGKMCKHRLAAMFVRKIQTAQTDRLTEILSFDGESITLRVLVINGSERKYSLAGYRYAGQNWVKFEDREDYIDFSASRFENAMTEAGWAMVQRPIKQPSLYYHYMLARGEAGYHLEDNAANVIERNQQNKRLEELMSIQDLIAA